MSPGIGHPLFGYPTSPKSDKANVGGLGRPAEARPAVNDTRDSQRNGLAATCRYDQTGLVELIAPWGRSYFCRYYQDYQVCDGHRLAFDVRSKAFTRDSRVHATRSDALRRVDRAGAPWEHRRFASLADLLKGLFERRIQEF
jgi:hypothetical protein